MLDAATLDRVLDQLPSLRIAVVGDLFLDKYLDLDHRLTETSIETGLDAYQVRGLRRYPGAGGTVINNLRSLGVGEVRAVSVIGDDGEGFDLLSALRKIGVKTEGVVFDGDWMTPTYTKPMLSQADGPDRELNRLDIRNRKSLPSHLETELIRRMELQCQDVHAVIIADQVVERNWGVVTDGVRSALSDLAARLPGAVFFADSRRRINEFRGITTKPNRVELWSAMQPNSPLPAESDNAAVFAAARELSTQTGRPVFVTLGPGGVAVVDPTKTAIEHSLGIPVSGPLDICGAGDSTTAGIVSALCCGCTPLQAARLGCLVASITIQQIGVTGTASPDQVRERRRVAAG
jgi:bifunctional ADP-heptose synthase (sugar kinase/adenylyltransferase)